jgi:hypothetical protein
MLTYAGVMKLRAIESSDKTVIKIWELCLWLDVSSNETQR